MKTLLALVLAALVLSVVPASAQAIAPIKWTLKYCAAPVLSPATCTAVGAAVDLFRGTTAADVQCNQAPIPAPPGTLTNPQVIEWNDPADLTKACFGPLPRPLPGAGDYAAVVTAIGTVGMTVNPPGTSATFTIVVPLPPLTPTGVHVR